MRRKNERFGTVFRFYEHIENINRQRNRFTLMILRKYFVGEGGNVPFVMIKFTLKRKMNSHFT